MDHDVLASESEAPVLLEQQGRDGTWQRPATQCTRRPRQLGENESRWTVRAVGGKCVDGGGQGGEHRSHQSGFRYGQRHLKNRAHRTARSADAAFVPISRRGRSAVMSSGRRVMSVCGLGRVCAWRRRGGVVRGGHLHRSRCTVMPSAAQRHACSGSTLYGHRQHQHPDQQCTHQTGHGWTVAQQVKAVGGTRCAPGQTPQNAPRKTSPFTPSRRQVP